MKLFILCLMTLSMTIDLNAQVLNKIFRFNNVDAGFMLSCNSDNMGCLSQYLGEHEGSRFRLEFTNSTAKEYIEETLIGTFYFTDGYSGYYLRKRDNKRLPFRIAQPDDFAVLISDNLIVQSLIGSYVTFGKSRWTFVSMEEVEKITRIDSQGTERILGLYLRDINTKQPYYMVLNIKFKLEDGVFKKDAVRVVSYNKI